MVGNIVEFICVFENLDKKSTMLTLGTLYSRNYQKLGQNLQLNERR